MLGEIHPESWKMEKWKTISDVAAAAGARIAWTWEQTYLHKQLPKPTHLAKVGGKRRHYSEAEFLKVVEKAKALLKGDNE